MLLLIDAYNLLHQSDVLHRDRGERWLAKARGRLVAKLAEHLDEGLAAETCLVFDAAAPPAGRASEFTEQSIRLLFAVDHDEADDLLEELIAHHPAPKRLTVISSDHRVQRAASRRNAKFFDADLWYATLVARGPMLSIPWPPVVPPGSPREAASEKPEQPLDQAELEAWMREFAARPSRRRGKPAGPRRVAVDALDVPKQTAAAPRPAKPAKQTPGKRPSERAPENRGDGSAEGEKPEPGSGLQRDLANPFPEGYGEDLLE